jgi:hypothetical protein
MWRFSLTRRRQIAVLIILVILAALIALPMRTVVYYYVMAPLAFFWFYLVYYYHVIPQQFYWIILIQAASYIALGGLLENPFRRERLQLIRTSQKGPVDGLAARIKDSSRGVYSRWKVARALGILAVEILELRGSRSSRVRALKGKDWNPPPGVQEYLEAGLNNSFADFPLSGKKTPFNIDLEKVVTYLETQVEMNLEKNK